MPGTVERKDLSLELFISSSKVATVVADMAGRLHCANTAFWTMSGYLPPELAGVPIDGLFLDGAVSGGEAEGDERRLRRKDGSFVWVRAIMAPLADGNQEILIQLIDIDRQKQTEAALLLNEKRMNFALEAANQGVWEVNIPANQVFFSPSWRSMRGIPADEPIDISLEGWEARMHPDDRDHVREVTLRYRTERQGYRELEYRERHRQGHFIWVQSRGQNIAWDEHGRATRIIGTDTDVTDRKIAEAEFQRVSHGLEMALKASGVGVWEVDLETGAWAWDDRMYEMYGLRPGIEMADIWVHMLHPDDREVALGDFQAAAEGRKKYASDFRILLPDGQVRHMRAGAEIFDGVGGGRKMIGVDWDVTADVRLNQELQKAKALAEQRYAELKQAQARLRHAALHDELTNLPNRRYLNRVMVERRAEAGKHQASLALMHIDLDWFKAINDTLGHAAGDAMLQHVADVLRDNVREGDFVARVGGDEFVMLCWFEGNIGDLSAMAERIIEQLREDVFYEGHPMHVGASIGIAYESGGAPSKPLQRDADAALYRAKELGRNRYEFAAA
ncbi:MAG TPA: diguanylate cyclase [Devosiaceae bacterium]|nr:diguanylate cyclase [Devosiaceae bacterium]